MFRELLASMPTTLLCPQHTSDLTQGSSHCVLRGVQENCSQMGLMSLNPGPTHQLTELSVLNILL